MTTNKEEQLVEYQGEKVVLEKIISFRDSIVIEVKQYEEKIKEAEYREHETRKGLETFQNWLNSQYKKRGALKKQEIEGLYTLLTKCYDWVLLIDNALQHLSYFTTSAKYNLDALFRITINTLKTELQGESSNRSCVFLTPQNLVDLMHDKTYILRQVLIALTKQIININNLININTNMNINTNELEKKKQELIEIHTKKSNKNWEEYKKKQGVLKEIYKQNPDIENNKKIELQNEWNHKENKNIDEYCKSVKELENMFDKIIV